MNVTKVGHRTIVVTLSERNLRALLLKVDDPHSHRTLVRRTEGDLMLWVTAEKDEDHYVDRQPGRMHPRTEEGLKAA